MYLHQSVRPSVCPFIHSFPIICGVGKLSHLEGIHFQGVSLGTFYDFIMKGISIMVVSSSQWKNEQVNEWQYIPQYKDTRRCLYVGYIDRARAVALERKGMTSVNTKDGLCLIGHRNNLLTFIADNSGWELE